MPRYKLTIQYLGSDFSGSQKQKNAKTVQDELGKALSTLTKTKINTIFSGRTDRGVSAKEQWIHFDSDYDCSTYKFINSMNGLLPDSISVKEVLKKEKTFKSSLL